MKATVGSWTNHFCSLVGVGAGAAHSRGDGGWNCVTLRAGCLGACSHPPTPHADAVCTSFCASVRSCYQPSRYPTLSPNCCAFGLLCFLGRSPPLLHHSQRLHHSLCARGGPRPDCRTATLSLQRHPVHSCCVTGVPKASGWPRGNGDGGGRCNAKPHCLLPWPREGRRPEPRRRRVPSTLCG